MVKKSYSDIQNSGIDSNVKAVLCDLLERIEDLENVQ
jgi:hypothetical protein